MEAMLAQRSSRRKQDGIKRSAERRHPCAGTLARPEGRVARARRTDYRRPTVSASPSVSRHDVIDAAVVRAALGRCRIVVERHAGYLTRLDTVLGDGDHGDNLVIGFRAVEAMLDDLPAETPPGELLRAVGHRLVAAVGGASGPLYGTAFLEAGATAADEPALDAATLGPMLAAAADGLARRGRCAVGDKTILDALRPAADAFVDAATGGASPAGAMASAVQAASRGMRSTRPLIARRGLALRLGERSIGHLDPGAVSCVLLLRAIGGG
jgi:phosphoenolpyruvate---glycerone phosphotransferase subunit DhaL